WGGLVFWRTTLGYRFELVGASREAARFGGVSVEGVFLSNLLLSAGIAGLAGWSDAFGIHHRLIDDFAIGYGNLGIVAALLGGLHPIGIAAASIVFAALVVGGQTMQRLAGIPFALVDVLQGLIIILILGRISLGGLRRRRRLARSEAAG
ncbi:MAG: ABC transporter permease, partial [Nitrospinota bacterium]